MVVKLTIEQIAANWELIKEALSASPSLCGELDGKYHRTLEALMNGTYQCWMSFDNPDDPRPVACAITGFLNDDLSGNKNLLLYLLYAYTTISKELLARGFIVFSRYAKSMGCTQIVGYTNTNQWDNLVKSLNGDISYRFFAVPLGG